MQVTRRQDQHLRVQNEVNRWFMGLWENKIQTTRDSVTHTDLQASAVRVQLMPASIKLPTRTVDTRERNNKQNLFRSKFSGISLSTKVLNVKQGHEHWHLLTCVSVIIQDESLHFQSKHTKAYDVSHSRWQDML